MNIMQLKQFIVEKDRELRTTQRELEKVIESLRLKKGIKRWLLLHLHEALTLTFLSFFLKI